MIPECIVIFENGMDESTVTLFQEENDNSRFALASSPSLLCAPRLPWRSPERLSPTQRKRKSSSTTEAPSLPKRKVSNANLLEMDDDGCSQAPSLPKRKVSNANLLEMDDDGCSQDHNVQQQYLQEQENVLSITSAVCLSVAKCFSTVQEKRTGTEPPSPPKRSESFRQYESNWR